MELINPNSHSYDATELFFNGDSQYFKTGFRNLDEKIRLRKGQSWYLTGYPFLGKSTFLRQVRHQLTHNYQMKHLLFDNESGSMVRQVLKEAEFLLKIRRNDYTTTITDRANENRLRQAIDHVAKYFRYIDLDTTLPTLDNFKKFVTEAKRKFDFTTMTIDPFSYLSYDQKSWNSLDEAIKEIEMLGRKLDIIPIIVIHPNTPREKNASGEYPCPNQYSIEGGKFWFSNAQLLGVWHRHGGKSMYRGLKNKEIGVGGIGDVYFNFDPVTGWYSED